MNNKCKHNKENPWGNECYFCQLENRLIELEAMISMNNLEIKAHKFSNDMEKGNHYIECLLGLENKLSERIEEIEARLKEVERFQDITHLQYKKITTHKSPYKCPVCNRLGYWSVKLITKDDDVKKSLSFDESLLCRSCEGKGILWG